MMKRMMMAMIAAVMFTSVAMAQDKQGKRPERKMDKAEMVKFRTDRMVKEYGLDDAQAQKLLELNTASLYILTLQ